MIKLLLRIANNLEYIVAGTLLVVIVSLLTINVFSRYVLGITISVTEELVRLLFVWMVLLASSVAAQHGAHIRVAAPTDLLPPRVRAGVAVVADLIWVTFNILVVVQGANLVASMFQYRYVSAALGWSMAWVYIAVPIGLTLTTLRVLQSNYRTWRARASSVGVQATDESLPSSS